MKKLRTFVAGLLLVPVLALAGPLGSDAESKGDSASTRWRVEFATSFASRRHQSKSANGSASRFHPVRSSTNASPGRLMHNSVTSGFASNGRSARSVRSSAELSRG